jgi:hypothetical protein
MTAALSIAYLLRQYLRLVFIADGLIRGCRRWV